MLHYTFKKITLSAFIGLSVLAGSVSIANAKTMKFSVSVPEDHLGGMQLKYFADLVKERSNGELDVRPFYNNQLGGEVEVAQGIQLGSVEGGLITMAALSRWVPEGDAFELPFIFKNGDYARKIMTGPYMVEFAQRYEDHGFKLLGFTTWGSRNVMSTFPIEKPEDVVGKKMRIMQNPMHAATWQALGANPTPIPAPEIYNALQTGLADYFDNNIISWHALKFYEVAPHLTHSAHMYQPVTFTVSKKIYDGLSDELQTILVDAAREAADYGFDKSKEMISEAVELAIKDGGHVHELQDQDVWIEKTRPVWKEWAGDNSERIQIIDKLIELQQ